MPEREPAGLPEGEPPRETIDGLQREVATLRGQLAELRAGYALPPFDPETGLLGQGAFLGKIADEQERSRRFGHPFALVALRLDAMPQGERFAPLFSLLARTIECECRNIDLPARLDDGFAMLLPGADLAGATVFAVRFRRTLSDLTIPPGLDPGLVRPFMGISAYGQGEEEKVTPDTLLTRAVRAARYATEIDDTGICLHTRDGLVLPDATSGLPGEWDARGEGWIEEFDARVGEAITALAIDALNARGIAPVTEMREIAGRIAARLGRCGAVRATSLLCQEPNGTLTLPGKPHDRLDASRTLPLVAADRVAPPDERPVVHLVEEGERMPPQAREWLTRNGLRLPVALAGYRHGHGVDYLALSLIAARVGVLESLASLATELGAAHSQIAARGHRHRTDGATPRPLIIG